MGSHEYGQGLALVNHLIITAADLRDAQLLGPRLRQADRDEIDAVTGEPPEVVIHRGIRQSVEPLTLLRSGLPIAVFGVVDHGWGCGTPWLLGTPEILDHWREFARRSREVLADVRPSFATLSNWVDARNTVHVRWLRWLGFTIGAPQPYGRLGLPFHHFSL